MKIHQSPIKKARIEIIPMIDVIFFLLVFFMMSSLSMVRMKGVGMALPRGGEKGGTTETGKGGGKIVVTVTPKGEFFVGRQKVAREEFKDKLAASVAGSPDSVVILNVAKSQNTQSLIDVIDSVNSVRSPSQKPLEILIATEPVDANGNALNRAKN